MSFFKDMNEDNRVWCVVYVCGTLVALGIVAALTVCTVYGPSPKPHAEPTGKVRIVPVE